MEEHFKKFVILFTILASAADCEDSNFSSTKNPSGIAHAASDNAIKRSEIPTNIDENKNSPTTDLLQMEEVVMEYLGDVMNKKLIKLWPGLTLEMKNETNNDGDRTQKSEGEGLAAKVGKFISDRTLKIELARNSRGVETGRFFFFKGLKKLMWPLFIGLQVVKTVLLVLFLPSIIGSVGKIVGKGLPSLSGTFSSFSQPAQANTEAVDDLDFKDNSFNSENSADGTYNSAYQYNIPSESKVNFVSQMYESAQANNANKRIGLDHSKLANGIMSKRDDFKVFHDIPSSSLLLSNYDPFYSPLLSRLDAIFQQLGLPRNSDERCREKLVCLMYSNPAKYAPYSNLVSAQLSRELNELRKPTSDNPDILRFFKYMRAAKDGQDGIDCEISYRECSSFSDMSGPAMINTFNDINKLVQARKLQS